MPTYEVMVEMIVPARQTVKINAYNETQALEIARSNLSIKNLNVSEDKNTWSLRSTKVKKLSSVIAPIDDD
jgi:hypothetical protein